MNLKKCLSTSRSFLEYSNVVDPPAVTWIYILIGFSILFSYPQWLQETCILLSRLLREVFVISLMFDQNVYFHH